LKVRLGGDWTPQALKAELARLGLSEARLAGLIGINQKSVNKWCRTAIPDDRQEQVTAVLRAYEEGLAP
jgi:transposase-like protein